VRNDRASILNPVLQLDLNEFQNQFHVPETDGLPAVFLNEGMGEGSAPDNVVPAVQGNFQLKPVAFGIVLNNSRTFLVVLSKSILCLMRKAASQICRTAIWGSKKAQS
jgi:hypothetical protein